MVFSQRAAQQAARAVQLGLARADGHAEGQESRGENT